MTQTQAQREADLAHFESAQALYVAEDAYESARREYLESTDDLATMIEAMQVDDKLRLAIYRAITAAQRCGEADEAVSTAKVTQRLRAVLCRVLTGTLTPSDFA